MKVINENLIKFIGRQQISGETDYVKDGVLHRGVNAASILVAGEADLQAIPKGLYSPGSVAYTAGFQAMWQLSVTGEWVPML